MVKEFLQVYVRPSGSGVATCDNEDSKDNKSETEATAWAELNQLVKNLDRIPETLTQLEP